MTMMRSASCTLEIRCAMISFVVSGISVRNAFRIFASVAVSTALVLSSRISTFGFFSSARVPIPDDVAKKSFLTRKDFEAVYAGEVS